MSSRNEKLERAYQLGYKYESEYGGCCQSTIAAIMEVLDLKNNDVFKCATGIAGGIGLVSKGLCGSLIGGALMIGYKYGRDLDEFADPEKKRFVTYKLVEELYTRFIKEYGGPYCFEVQERIFGGFAYNLRNEKSFRRFLEDGGHRDKCPCAVGKGAQWATEIILDEEKREKEGRKTKPESWR